MSLIVNEIHTPNGLDNAVLIAAADTQITFLGKFFAKRTKVLDIPYLKATVSYFGLASTTSGGSHSFLDDALRKYINHCAKQQPLLPHFVSGLQAFLNTQLGGRGVLNKYASGLHICGFGASGLPEFWYLSNIGSFSNGVYGNFSDYYSSPTEDYQRRDALALGWDGVTTTMSLPSFTYRNGVILAHQAFFTNLDSALAIMQASPTFKTIKSELDYAHWIATKLKFTCTFYRRWMTNPTIGGAVDVIVSTRASQTSIRI